MGRKQCRKRRNCSLRAISPFPTVFSKGLYCRHIKTRDCLRKGKPKNELSIIGQKTLWENVFKSCISLGNHAVKVKLSQCNSKSSSEYS